jgi:hypothetical protein
MEWPQPFTQVLAKSGVTVRGISRKGTPKPEATFSDYLSADPCNPNEEVGLLAFLHGHNLVRRIQ